MELPSTKVTMAIVAALIVAAAEQIGDDGIPNGLAGWLTFVGKTIGAAAAVGGAGYVTTERRPPRSLVAAILADTG